MINLFWSASVYYMTTIWAVLTNTAVNPYHPFLMLSSRIFSDGSKSPAIKTLSVAEGYCDTWPWFCDLII